MLLTKIHIPSAGNNIVHRPELYEQLKSGLSRKLILISAPAGFGKTSLLSNWIRKEDIPTAWFSIDKSDNDPAEFLSYIIAGIQGIGKEFGQTALRLIKSPNKPSNESIIRLFINDILTIDENFLLVLDDFHLISNSEILMLTAYFLDHIPENIHLVILTRSDPAIAVARLRSQHQLLELRSSALSFSAGEIFSLFNKNLKLGLSTEDIYSLETKTEGWIAGLQLIALSLQDREDISEFIQGFKGDNRYIMDYLIEEVLKIQTDDTKEFLLQTSILEQISVPLCNAVLNRNDSQTVIEGLEKNNMFIIPLDAERKWYRYHHLFAELLRQRFHQRDKAAVRALHNKAGEWFKHNSMPLLAIEHATEAADFEKSTAILGTIIAYMWENGQHAAILKYGDQLPDELIKKNTEICLYYSWVLITAGKAHKAEPFLLSAEKITSTIIHDITASEEEVKHNKKLLGKISVALAYQQSFLPVPDKIFDYCKTAMENLSEKDPLWFSWGWYSLGIAEMARERIAESIEALQNALEYGKKSGNPYLISTISITLAYNEGWLGLLKSSYKRCEDVLILMNESGYGQITKAEGTYAALYANMAAMQYLWADLDQAYEHVITAYSLSANGSNVSYKALVIVMYSIILEARGDKTGALKKIQELEGILEKNRIAPNVKSLYIAWKGTFLIEQQQTEKARIFLEENGIGPDHTITYAVQHAYVSYALLLITESKTGQAEVLLSKLYELAQAQKGIERMTEIKILYAILYKVIGDKEKAVVNLTESMEFAAGNDILMYFVAYLGLIGDLLREIFNRQEKAGSKIPDKFIDKLKVAIEKREKLQKSSEEVSLSGRELDTLQLIAKDFSNQVIADQLFVSLNTVKTHIKKIYQKLEVNSRRTAVEKARKLGLI